MSYRPNYCCNCGEKIERTEWLPWTSGRFCQLCDKEFKFQDRLPIAAVLAGLILSIFGIGAYMSRGGEQIPLVVKQKSVEASKALSALPNQNTAAQRPVNSQVNAQTLLQTQASPSDIKPAPVAQNASTDAVKKSPAREELTYFCGAMTKKGTACSRRVKGGGRCFQHKGQEAILSSEKLLISN